MNKLVLVRHGESIFNRDNKIAGRINVDLTDEGKKQAKETGILLSEMEFSAVYTSTLNRAKETARIILEQNLKTNIFPFAFSEMNEQYFGEIEGADKSDLTEKFGAEKVLAWRRSFDVCPPEGESFADLVKRSSAFFEKNVKQNLEKGNILLVGHGNWMRSLAFYLEKIPKEKLSHFEFENARARVYTCNSNFEIINAAFID